MVIQFPDDRGDAVAKRLAAAGDAANHNVIEWMTAQQERTMMRRRATWCAVGGWMLMAAAGVVSCVAVSYTHLRAHETYITISYGVFWV